MEKNNNKIVVIICSIIAVIVGAAGIPFISFAPFTIEIIPTVKPVTTAIIPIAIFAAPELFNNLYVFSSKILPPESDYSAFTPYCA